MSVIMIAWIKGLIFLIDTTKRVRKTWQLISFNALLFGSFHNNLLLSLNCFIYYHLLVIGDW